MLKDSKRQPYGGDKNILQTEYDPIYQTQRVGIDKFKLDVPDGKYEVTLLFAELLSSALKDLSIYNLDTSHIVLAAAKKIEPRSFDVYINKTKVMESLGNDNYLIPETAVSSKFEIEVTDGKGITVDFKAIMGEAILNGIQVRKVY